ncbi:FAD-dependent oxidoreductase [Amycolatopsis pigmentata]|uniref:Kynurenine 3-monooxygenase n=1 Tax=Amycolatopsis pigmentata TaxID=450801 RepID=A0ABW5FPX0_9PSEU
MNEIAVVGGGLAGSLLACFLAQRGEKVVLYERRSDPRAGTPERGRSINLALSERGLNALRRVQLDKEVLADALPMRGRMIHPVAGELDFQPYSADGERAINSISRGALNNVLLDAAESVVDIRFAHRLSELDPETGTMVFQTPDGEVRTGAAVIFGADGAGSAVRGQLVRHGVTEETLDFLDYGYKELTIPPRDGEFALDPGALHIWPRGASMMIALPNPDRSFTCTLFWPNSGTGAFASLSSPSAIERFFAARYPDVPPLVPGLVADYQQNPVGLLGTVRCAPWRAGRVCLIGDAAHAIVPFYGQGANCAFEDVVVLDDCFERTDGNWAETPALFEASRREDTEAIAQMALANFTEMRDKVSSPVYRLGKRIEHTLERFFPGRYVSRYELVSFSNVPYAQVRRRVRTQHGALVAAGIGLSAAIAGGTAKAWRRS